MATVLLFERHPVEVAAVEPFQHLVAAHVASMRTAPGALWADAARAFDDDPSFVMLSEWRTHADLDAFASGEEAIAFRTATEAMRREHPTIRRFTGEAG